MCIKSFETWEYGAKRRFLYHPVHLYYTSHSNSSFNVCFIQLLHLGKDYPEGYDFFHTRLKKAFMKNKDVTDPEQIKILIERGEFVVKEIEALYMLKKYRTLKRRYYDSDDSAKLSQMCDENVVKYNQ